MLKKYFLQNYLFLSSKELFFHNIRQFLKKRIYERNSTGADLTKLVKILYYLKLCKENNFWLNYLFLSSKEVFLHNFRQFFWKLNFWRKFDRRRPYKKIVKLRYYLKLCYEIIFWLNYLFLSSKDGFLHNFRQFFENWIFDRNSTGADLTKIVKFKYYFKLCKEIIFWLNYLFLSSKEVFLHNFRQFFENWIFDKNSTGADLTKIIKIRYYLKLC